MIIFTQCPRYKAAPTFLTLSTFNMGLLSLLKGRSSHSYSKKPSIRPIHEHDSKRYSHASSGSEKVDPPSYSLSESLSNQTRRLPTAYFGTIIANESKSYRADTTRSTSSTDSKGNKTTMTGFAAATPGEKQSHRGRRRHSHVGAKRHTRRRSPSSSSSSSDSSSASSNSNHSFKNKIRAKLALRRR